MNSSINLSVSLTLQHCVHIFITLLLEPAYSLQMLHVVVIFGTRTNDSQPMGILLYRVPYCDTVTEHMDSIFLTDNNTRLYY